MQAPWPFRQEATVTIEDLHPVVGLPVRNHQTAVGSGENVVGKRELARSRALAAPGMEQFALGRHPMYVALPVPVGHVQVPRSAPSPRRVGMLKGSPGAPVRFGSPSVRSTFPSAENTRTEWSPQSGI